MICLISPSATYSNPFSLEDPALAACPKCALPSPLELAVTNELCSFHYATENEWELIYKENTFIYKTLFNMFFIGC